ncbi:MAG: signal peptidase II [Propionibacteriaceae bacterium]|nr:signal peptidase II [Propionibacteriaceae bacterium]
MQAARGKAIAITGESAPRVWPVWLSIALVGYALDLGSKIVAVAYLDPNDPPVLLGGLLRLQLTRNPGAAFSLGSNLTVVLSIVAIAALLGVACYAAPRAKTVAQAVIVGLMLAGIAGNLTDRLFRAPGPLRGHVVDMFQFPYFAIFNVADVFITTAAGLIILIALRGDRR